MDDIIFFINYQNWHKYENHALLTLPIYGVTKNLALFLIINMTKLKIPMNLEVLGLLLLNMYC